MKNAQKSTVVGGGIAFFLFFSLFVQVSSTVGQQISYINFGEWYEGNTNTYGNLTIYLFNTTFPFQQVTVYLIGPPTSLINNYAAQMRVLHYQDNGLLLLQMSSAGLDAVASTMACPEGVKGTYEVQIFSQIAGSPYRFQITEQGKFYLSLY
jgi:hypothetical protein